MRGRRDDYRVISGSYRSPDGIVYKSYGIAAGTLRAEDLSLDRAAVEALAAACNRLSVPAAYLWEIAEDFAAGECAAGGEKNTAKRC